MDENVIEISLEDLFGDDGSPNALMELLSGFMGEVPEHPAYIKARETLGKYENANERWNAFRTLVGYPEDDSLTFSLADAFSLAGGKHEDMPTQEKVDEEMHLAALLVLTGYYLAQQNLGSAVKSGGFSPGKSLKDYA